MSAKIYKKANGYQVYFMGKWGTYSKEEDAKDKAFELNFTYYSEHRDKLPKGILIDIADKRFRFHVRLSNSEIKMIKSSKDLNELIEMRKHMLNYLLDLL